MRDTTAVRKRTRSVLAGALAGLLGMGTIGASSAEASFVGDLVFCDTNGNGIYEPGAGETGLNGVGVDVECRLPDNTICFAASTQTGTIDASAVGELALFQFLCGGLISWDPAGDLTGRYLVEPFNACNNAGAAPYTCRVTVDQSTAPADCNMLTTPLEAGPPNDGNNDGDFCDAEDGPFAEGQTLGNQADSNLTCNQEPDPAPADGMFTAVINPAFDDDCLVYNDFGFKPVPRTPTRTPGYWKEHPTVIDGSFDGPGGFLTLLPFTFCGKVIATPCDAYKFLNTSGGGLDAFKRHGMAGRLNCRAFGCPAEIAALIEAGSNACATRARYPFGATAMTLDAYNNSGDLFPLPFQSPPAQSMYCGKK